jgi:SAM-dependent methyltransferase
MTLPRGNNTPTPAGYDREFFQAHSDVTRASAHRLVPYLIELVRPESVLDVGCGAGDWLEAFLRYGVRDVVGLDGYSPDDRDLRVPRERLHTVDLEQPFRLGRRFGLVVCLEVAEHLRAEAAADFIETLTRHGDVIAFSAAIPGQGGRGHLNEQWLEYWARLFECLGYSGYDLVRPTFWECEAVAHYYRQNLVLFATGAAAERLGAASAVGGIHGSARSLVHPETFRGHLIAVEAHHGMRHALRALFVELRCRLGLASVGPPHYPEYAPGRTGPDDR